MITRYYFVNVRKACASKRNADNCIGGSPVSNPSFSFIYAYTSDPLNIFDLDSYSDTTEIYTPRKPNEMQVILYTT